jgi:hypothetical protein
VTLQIIAGNSGFAKIQVALQANRVWLNVSSFGELQVVLPESTEAMLMLLLVIAAEKMVFLCCTLAEYLLLA